MQNTIEDIKGKSSALALVGSRVTCNPAPQDTDQDVLVLLSAGEAARLIPELMGAGFCVDGSDIRDPREHLGAGDTFQSFSLGDLNLILTQDGLFYRKFMAATSVAKRLNLLNKADRVALFQAVLYGNFED